MNIKKYNKKTTYYCEKINKTTNYEHLNNNYCKKNQIVFTGDSITEIFNINELFDDFCKENNIEIYNRGISGDTSNRLLERIDKTVINLEPKAVALMIGTNDFGCGADSEFVFCNIVSIVERIHKALPSTKIILECLTPVNTNMYHFEKARASNIIKLNEHIREYAYKNGYALVDVYNKMIDSNGQLNKKYTYDGLHPNVFGFEIIANELKKELGKII